MAEIDDIKLLRQIPAVANLPPWQLEAISRHVERIQFKKKSRLIARGSDDGYTYFLSAGKILLDCPGDPQMVVEAGADAARAPIANLRPRIVDVTALDRVDVIRVPDILLQTSQYDAGLTAGDGDQNEGQEQPTGPSFERRLPFELYRDLQDDERSILPSLPDTAVRIQLAIEDEHSNADSVARLIATDPAMATKLIKTANSALYGGRSPIETLTAGVVRLGIKTTRDLVLTFAIKEVFRTKDKQLRQRMTDLWTNSTFVAATCFVLARKLPGINAEEALLAGLVQDTGVIAIINYAAREQQLLTPEQLDLLISRTGGELSALILRRWRFAPEITVAARGARQWTRSHAGAADLLDLLIVANVHERLHSKQTDKLPPVEDIPAFAKVLGPDATPDQSLEILRQANIVVDLLRGVLRR